MLAHGLECLISAVHLVKAVLRLYLAPTKIIIEDIDITWWSKDISFIFEGKKQYFIPSQREYGKYAAIVHEVVSYEFYEWFIFH